MKRLVAPILAVILLVAGAVAVLEYTSGDAATAELVVTELEGEVHVVNADGASENVVRGLLLDPHDRVSTGSGSRAVLSLGDTSRIRLGPLSSVQYVGRDDQAITLELEGGAVQATVRPGATALRVGNRGREVLATDGAFEMGLAEDGTLVVEMSDGAAMTSGFDGVSQLSAGDRATVSSDGSAGIEPIPAKLLLTVNPPIERKTREKTAIITGKTTPGATVTVSGGVRAVQHLADRYGNFSVEIALVEGDHTLSVEAVDPLGKTAVVDDHSILAKWSGPSVGADVHPTDSPH